MTLVTGAAPDLYAHQLEKKTLALKQSFSPFDPPELQVYASPASGYRMRAEFRIWHAGDDVYYAMFDPDQPKTPVRIDNFDIASERIQQAMPLLLEKIKLSQMLRKKLFQVTFLSTLDGGLLVTLIYHRSLEEDWSVEATELGELLNAKMIGRSRKQRVVISDDFIDEVLEVGDRHWRYRQYEQGFTQPNAKINQHMLDWASRIAAELDGDLLELYCGNGNFSLPLSQCFGRVLATEVSKASMNAARFNAQANGVENLDLVRLSAEEVTQALAGVREFRRLSEVRALSEYDFSTVFVDPPRAGLDAGTEKLVAGFNHIIYISCNPETLQANLKTLCETHRIERFALFDQFPYTHHIESGVFLTRMER